MRKFFDDYNRHTAHRFKARFEVVDWENYATIGVGRPQELITRQMLKPISRKHIEKAAAKAGIRPGDIDVQVASLSAHLGWDLTLGAKKKA